MRVVLTECADVVRCNQNNLVSAQFCSSAVSSCLKFVWTLYEDEEKLIDLVKKNPPLYGVKNKSYKDIELKENIWKTIAHELNKSVSDCKLKWKHIRDYYQRQRREGKKSTGSAAGSGSGNRYDNLQFLEGSFVERGTKTNVPTKKQKITDVEREQESQGTEIPLTERDDTLEEIMDQDEQMSQDLQEISQVECQQKQQDLESQDEGDSDNPEQTEDENNARPLSTPQPPCHKQKPRKTNSSRSSFKKSTIKREILQEIQKGRKERLDLLLNMTRDHSSQSESSHPIDLFFRSMASIVKTFPPRVMLDARNKIYNLVGELELQSVIEQEAANAASQVSRIWTAPSDIPFMQSSSPTYSTHSSSTAVTSQFTSQSESIPHTPTAIAIGDGSDTPHYGQTYGNYSVQAQSPIGETIENTIRSAEFTILN